MLIMTFALASAATVPALDQQFVAAAQSACAAPIDERPELKDISIEPLEAAPGDLPKLRITDRRSGGWLLAYYDAAGERVAYARAACLGAQLRLLATELGEVAPHQEWFSPVFTTNTNYVAPARQSVTRWTIPLEAGGRLAKQGQSMLVLTILHEQVHKFQKRAGTELPRWLEEGHAEWISRKVRRLLSPTAEQADEDVFRSAFEASTPPLALGSWGGMRVKREAIMRQVPPEERIKMEADPAYTAPLSGRSFSIGPDDVTSDESNLKARYEASWRLFRDIEAVHGQSAVQSWVAQLTARPGRVDGAAAISSAREALHEELSERLG
jgi:hypothetical protein